MAAISQQPIPRQSRLNFIPSGKRVRSQSAVFTIEVLHAVRPQTPGPINRQPIKAGKDAAELRDAVNENTRLSRHVAAAVESRDLPEIRKVLANAGISRPQLSAACERLGSLAAKDGADGTRHDAPVTDGRDPETLPGDRDPKAKASPPFFLDTPDAGGTTALILAALQDDPETVRYLLRAVSTAGLT